MRLVLSAQYVLWNLASDVYVLIGLQTKLDFTFVHFLQYQQNILKHSSMFQQSALRFQILALTEKSLNQAEQISTL